MQIINPYTPQKNPVVFAVLNQWKGENGMNEEEKEKLAGNEKKRADDTPTAGGSEVLNIADFLKRST